MFRFLRSLAARVWAGLLFLAAGLWPRIQDRVQDWLWKFAEWTVDKTFGDAAFAWLRAKTDALMNPVWQDALWSWGPTVLLCGAGVYLLVRRGKPQRALADVSAPERATGVVSPRPPKPTPSDAPAERTKQAPRHAVAPSPAQVTPPAEPDWGKLYEMVDGATDVRLRFLPDTAHQQDDAALLIVLGHKVMLGRDRAHAGQVNFETQRAMYDAPNSPVPEPLRNLSFMRRVVQQPDLAQRHVDNGLLRRTALAQGGFYELTSEGEETGRIMARGLIQRA